MVNESALQGKISDSATLSLLGQNMTFAIRVAPGTTAL